jgi:L-aspartate oxidase
LPSDDQNNGKRTASYSPFLVETMKTTDVLIIGSGIAGSVAALKLAKNPDRRIILITRSPDPHDSNTRWAQGGIIHRGQNDSANLLVQDILAAGAGASLPEAARILAEEGPARLDEILIQEVGVEFDHEDSGAIAYTQEAAHSVRRILHVGDGTGKAIIQALISAVSRHPNIEMITGATAVDLITHPHHSREPRATYRPVACHGA